MSSSQSKPALKLDWCSYEAAKYAVEKWHYSKRMPAGKNVYIGAWEDARFVGCIVFGKGVCGHLVGTYGLDSLSGCELVRVALKNGHSTPVSRMVAIALKMAKQQSPGLRLVVSFADPFMNHNGGIYQAGNWVYTGTTGYKQGFLVSGRRVTDRLVSQKVKEGKWVRAALTPVESPPKHRYLYPLDPAMRAQILPLAKPYPKRPSSIVADASGDQPGESGATPTGGLQSPRLSDG